MGKHQRPEDAWWVEWLRLMREAWVPAVHVCGSVLIHTVTVWIYYEWVH